MEACDSNMGDDITRPAGYRMQESSPHIPIREHRSSHIHIDASKVPQNSLVCDSLDLPEEQQMLNSRSSKMLHRSRSAFYMTGASKLFEASETNKLSMKMFRSRDAIREERERQRDTQRFVIHPFSTFRWYWDLFMVFLMCCAMIHLPVSIAFFSDSYSVHWAIINCITDAVFISDIILNFFTGIISHDTEEVILDRSTIIRHYLSGWFLIDAVSSMPFDYVYISISGDVGIASATALTLRVLRLTKLLSLLRLLRLTRLLRYVHRLEEILNVEAGVIRIFNLVSIVVVLSHWNGCIQYLIVFLNSFPDDSWIKRTGLEDAGKFELYTRSLFRAMSHMLCIGYGQYPPVNVLEVWTVICSMLIGATFYALFIGNMSSLMLSIDASGRLYNQELNQVKEYMRFRKVPMETQQRVLMYYEQRYQRKYFNEVSILNKQSKALKKELILHNCKLLVSKVSFLREAGIDVVYDITSRLTYEVFLPGDEIVRAGTRGDAMYFIEHGSVEIAVPNGRSVSNLGDGSHFGEISLLTDTEMRVASVIAKAVCYVYILDRENFDAVLQNHPEAKEIIERVANERLFVLNSIFRESSHSMSSEKPVVHGPLPPITRPPTRVSDLPPVSDCSRLGDSLHK